MTNRKRGGLAGPIVAALVAGGAAGAGVGLHWYSPAFGVGMAVLIGVAVGAVVLRTARQARRGTR